MRTDRIVHALAKKVKDTIYDEWEHEGSILIEHEEDFWFSLDGRLYKVTVEDVDCDRPLWPEEEKGLDRTMTEYFASGMKRVVAVVPNPDFTLTLTFDNGEKRLLDCNPLLKPGTVFETFMQWENFRRVYVDKTGGCVAWDIDPHVDSEVVWNNKVDLCPDSCYVGSKPVE